MVFSVPANSATYREGFGVRFSPGAYDWPGVHLGGRRTGLLGSIPCLLLPGAECCPGSRSQQMLVLGCEMAVNTRDHCRIHVAHEFGERCRAHAVQQTVGPVRVADLVYAGILPQAHFLSESRHLKPNCVRRPLAAAAVYEDVLGRRLPRLLASDAEGKHPSVCRLCRRSCVRRGSSNRPGLAPK